MLNALHLLREKEELSPSCPSYKDTTSRWRVLKGIRRKGKSKAIDGMLKIGDEGGDGLEVSQDDLTRALTALNNFIHEHREF